MWQDCLQSVGKIQTFTKGDSMQQNLPKDPVMLLSFVNTQLRDFYPTLESLCDNFHINADELKQKLSGIDYEYDAKQNQFI